MPEASLLESQDARRDNGDGQSGNSSETEPAFARGFASTSRAAVFRLMPMVLPYARLNDDAFSEVEAWAVSSPPRPFAKAWRPARAFAAIDQARLADGAERRAICALR
jgi:hypothetical protein